MNNNNNPNYRHKTIVRRGVNGRIASTSSRVSGKELVFFNARNAKPGATVLTIGTVHEAAGLQLLEVSEAHARRLKAKYEQAEIERQEAEPSFPETPGVNATEFFNESLESGAQESVYTH